MENADKWGCSNLWKWDLRTEERNECISHWKGKNYFKTQTIDSTRAWIINEAEVEYILRIRSILTFAWDLSNLTASQWGGPSPATVNRIKTKRPVFTWTSAIRNYEENRSWQKGTLKDKSWSRKDYQGARSVVLEIWGACAWKGWHQYGD